METYICGEQNSMVRPITWQHAVNKSLPLSPRWYIFFKLLCHWCSKAYSEREGGRKSIKDGKWGKMLWKGFF